METLNRIELRGIVGSVRTQHVSDETITRFSMATIYAYKDKDGCPVIETTWHNVLIWNAPEAQLLAPGSRVYVSGRLRAFRYVTADGLDRVSVEVVAQQLEVVETVGGG